jgi:hypothetical protein
VNTPPERAADQARDVLDSHQHERRQHRYQERERDDVAARRAPAREELRMVPEEIE